MRFEKIDIARLIAEGRGDKSFIGLKPTCKICDQKGMLQIRPKNSMIGDGSPKTDEEWVGKILIFLNIFRLIFQQNSL